MSVQRERTIVLEWMIMNYKRALHDVSLCTTQTFMNVVYESVEAEYWHLFHYSI